MQPLPIRAVPPGNPAGLASDGFQPPSLPSPTRATGCRTHACPAAAQGEGLLHDARNLMGALGLYCDLLSLPGVLKPEHRHYSEELRQLGERSNALIEHVMQFLLVQGGAGSACAGVAARTPGADSRVSVEVRPNELASAAARAVKPVSLRTIVERSLGLLSRVAGGREIEVTYGAAAAVPVRVAEEAVERILVNLVRNAASALREREQAEGLPGAPTGSGAASLPGKIRGGHALHSVAIAVQGPDEDRDRDAAAGGEAGAIRLGVGLLVNRVGDPRPWPFRRVRITVEDSGCGMTAAQLERLIGGGRAPSRGCHGIGFGVVRELVAVSDGDLRMMSEPGVGTRVQIEWPVAVLPAENEDESAEAPANERRLNSSGGELGRWPSC